MLTPCRLDKLGRIGTLDAVDCKLYVISGVRLRLGYSSKFSDLDGREELWVDCNDLIFGCYNRKRLIRCGRECECGESYHGVSEYPY